jgi:tryptophanyl-tRNA synthetase
VLGLDGQAKMSKSLGNTINLLEGPEEIWAKLRPAMTDPARQTKKDPGDPEVCNLFTIHRAFGTPEQLAHVDRQCRTAGWGCLDCKRLLADNMIAALAPIRERAAEWRARPERVREVLGDGAARCRALAEGTLVEVRRLMGLATP